jgi:hypothetical protein
MEADCKALLLFCLLFPALSAGGQTVYKSIENGVPSFSDSPPADDRPVETIVIDVPAPAADPRLDERLKEMRESTDRMAEDRREREAHRAALRAQRIEAPPPAAPDPATVIVTNSGYWPLYGRPHRPLYPRPPYRPQPLPQPLPPPGWSVMAPGNAQLMRPIVSGPRSDQY